MVRKVLLTVLAVSTVFGVSVSTAHAARKGSDTSSSISLNTSDPHLGGMVSFSVTYPSTVKSPRVAVRCYQSGVLVYAEAGTAFESFQLGGGSSDWLRAGGPAQCTGELFYFIWKPNQPQEYYSLAWTSFDAAG